LAIPDVIFNPRPQVEVLVADKLTCAWWQRIRSGVYRGERLGVVA
jgi:hypothetical protein